MAQQLKTVGIATNPLKPKSRAVKKEMVVYLRSAGVRVLPAYKAEVLITIGGDGTILYNKNRYRKPVWAIGSDTSFLCQSNVKAWKKDLGMLLKNGYNIQRRSMLSAKLDGARLPDALNEVVVRSRLHRVMGVKLSVGGRRFKFLCDGLIVCTATGSTAYAYSAGGRQMRAEDRRIQVVPIAPYRRAFKPMMLNANAIIRAEIFEKCPADLTIDGQVRVSLKQTSKLVVIRASREMEFVQTAGRKK
ncbi:NAD kinase [uncultured archaeon]|nr:NAD kinase [uncultured archaeon]